MKTSSEFISAAAVRFTDHIAVGACHFDALMNLEKSLGPIFETIQNGIDEGFLTNTNRFVSREEAYDIAQAADQYSQLQGESSTEGWLDSAEVQDDPLFCQPL